MPTYQYTHRGAETLQESLHQSQIKIACVEALNACVCLRACVCVSCYHDSGSDFLRRFQFLYRLFFLPLPSFLSLINGELCGVVTSVYFDKTGRRHHRCRRGRLHLRLYLLLYLRRRRRRRRRGGVSSSTFRLNRRSAATCATCDLYALSFIVPV